MRNQQDVLEVCQDLARFIFPYPIDGRHRLAWWRFVCEEAGVRVEGEDLTLTEALSLFYYLQSQVAEMFEEITALHEERVRTRKQTY